MSNLDFASLWDNVPPEQSNKPKKVAPKKKQQRDSKQYTDLKKEYQQYIQHNREIERARKEVNQAMVKMIKDSEEGASADLLDDSLKIISKIMRNDAFYIQIKKNLESAANE